MKHDEYPVIIEQLPEEDGGGFVAIAPHLPGCVSEGDTPEAALASVQAAIDTWAEEAEAIEGPFPGPRNT